MAAKLFTFIETKHQVIVISIITLTLITGFFYSYHVGNHFNYQDEREYYAVAKNVVEQNLYSNNGVNSTSKRPPGYPLFLIPFIYIGLPVYMLRFVNFILLALAIYMIYRLLLHNSSPFSAVLGPVLMLGYPVLFYTAGTLYPQILAGCIFLIILYYSNNKSSRFIVMAVYGILLPYLVITVPIYLFVLLFLLFWSALFRESKQFKRLLIAVLATVCFSGIWSYRHYRVYDQFVFLATNSGVNLLLGNSENTTPNSGLTTDISRYRDEVRNRGYNHAEANDYYKSEAIKWIMANKGAALKLYCLKALNYFNYHNELYTKTESSGAKDLVMLASYGPLLIIFLIRLLSFKLFRITRFEAQVILIYIYSAFCYAIFFTRIRFRIPFDLLLLYVVAGFLGEVIVRWRETRILTKKLTHSNQHQPDQLPEPLETLVTSD